MQEGAEGVAFAIPCPDSTVGFAVIPRDARETSRDWDVVTAPTTIEFICNSDASETLAQFWFIPGMRPLPDASPEDGRAHMPAPWGPASMVRHGVVSGMPISIEVWTISDASSQVRLSSDARSFAEAERMALLLDAKARLTSGARQPDASNRLSGSGFSYIATCRNDTHSGRVSEALESESLALRSETGSVLLRNVSLGLVDFPRRRLVVGMNMLTRNHVPMHGLHPYPGGPEVPLNEIPGVRVLNLNNPYDPFSLSVSPDGDKIATIYYAGRGFISYYDIETGRRHFVTALEGIAGYERPAFSPDGEWILVDSYPQPRIVRCSDGLTLDIPELPGSGGKCWYELENKVGVLSIGTGSGDRLLPERVLFTDLETSVSRHLGDVVVPDSQLPPGRRLLFQPMSGSDGRLLVGSWYGPSASHQEENGSHHRVAILNLNTMDLAQVVAPFADKDALVEREHKMWSWNSPFVSSQPLKIADALLEAGAPRSLHPEPAEEEYLEQTWLLVDFDSPMITDAWA